MAICWHNLPASPCCMRVCDGTLMAICWHNFLLIIVVFCDQNLRKFLVRFLADHPQFFELQQQVFYPVRVYTGFLCQGVTPGDELPSSAQQLAKFGRYHSGRVVSREDEVYPQVNSVRIRPVERQLHYFSVQQGKPLTGCLRSVSGLLIRP